MSVNKAFPSFPATFQQ